MATEGSGVRVGPIAYWGVALGLTLFGFLALLSIGAPFLLLGLTLMVMFPFRHRRGLFWPVVVGVLAMSAVFLLVAPFGCEREGTLSAEGVEEEAHATCSSVIGIRYSGVGDWDPSYLPAVIAGLAAGGIGAATTRLVGTRRPASVS